MFTETEKSHCRSAKEIFENRYRPLSVSLAKIVDRTVFAGGLFSSILLNETPRDIDIFISKTEDEDYTIFENYCKVNTYPINKKITGRNKYADMNPHIHSVWKMTRGKIDYDIIFTDYSSPEEIISDFDYEHSKVWYHSGNLYLSEKTYRAIMNMKLILVEGKTAKTERRKKFLDRGWKE